MNSQTEARLAHPRLADDGDDLAVPGTRLLEGLAELLHLGVAADEAGQPPRRGGLAAASAPCPAPVSS